MSSYLPAKFVFFLKSRLLFNIFYSFCMFVNKHFILSNTHNSKSKWCDNAKLLEYYFYVKKKMSVDFQICISVPLIDDFSKWWDTLKSLVAFATRFLKCFWSFWNIIYLSVKSYFNCIYQFRNWFEKLAGPFILIC